jgi:hypothetical protein
MSAEEGSDEWTCLGIRESVHSRLTDLKQYESMSFNDLLNDMADTYEGEREET